VVAEADDAGLTEARGKWILPIGEGKVTQLGMKAPMPTATACG
jgi:hypothetical protein